MTRSPSYDFRMNKIEARGRLVWFLASAVAAAIGRHGYFIVCAWTLVKSGLGSSAVATFLLVVSLSEILASPIVGKLVDHFDRHMLNIISDVMRALAIFATAVFVYYDSIFMAVGVSAVVLSALDRLSLTASQALVPTLSRGQTLAMANSWFFGMTQCGNFAAAFIAAFLLENLPPAFAIAALVPWFVLSSSSLILMGCRGRKDGPADPRLRDDTGTIGRRFARFCLVYTLLYGAALLTSVLGAGYVFEEHAGDATDFALLEAAWSTGSIVGAFVLPAAQRWVGTRVLELMALAGSAAAMALLKFVGMPWSFVLFFSLALFHQLGSANLEVMVQFAVPTRALGRTKGVIHSIGVGAGLLTFSFAAGVGGALV